MTRFKNNKIFFVPSLILLFILVIILADQFVKYLILNLGLPSVCNRGFAFGLGAGFFNGLVAVVVLAGLMWILNNEKKDLAILGYSLIIGGGYSNLVDRVTRGCVVDFINFKILPSFNLADALITIGVGLILIQYLNIKWTKH